MLPGFSGDGDLEKLRKIVVPLVERRGREHVILAFYLEMVFHPCMNLEVEVESLLQGIRV